MGHKVNPISFRLATGQAWLSKWFSNNQYATYLREDTQIREFLEKHYRRAGVVRVEIGRNTEGVAEVSVFTTRPGMLIGKSGSGVEALSKRVKQELGLKFPVKLLIEEVKDANLSAQAIANHIAEQIEKRVAFRRLMKQALEQVMNSGARGVKVAIGGRLNGAEIARTEHLTAGVMPLHTLRANIDFARSTAFTTYGTVGIKVWVASEQGGAARPAGNNPQGMRPARRNFGGGAGRRP